MRSGGPRAQAGRIRTGREHELNEDAVHAPCWLARHVQSEYERRGEGLKDALAAPYLFGDLGERDRETGTAIDSRNGTVRPRLLVVSWALKQKGPAISGRSFGSA